MRTSLLLLSTAFVLAACSDNPSTAPVGSRSASGAVSHDVSPDNPGSGQAKPNAAVAFTTITTVVGPTVSVDAITFVSNNSTATCPAGTHVIGGGYEVLDGVATVKIQRSVPNNANGWTVIGYLLNGPNSTGQFRTTALCIQ